MGSAGTLLNLFVRFFKVGLISFGGGWAVLAIIEKEIVEDAKWLTPSEYVNLVGIAGSTPGPISVNAATYIGHKVAGFPGAVVATTAVVMPSFIVMSVIAYLAFRYMGNPYVRSFLNGLKSAVIALIALSLYLTTRGVLRELTVPSQAVVALAITAAVILAVEVWRVNILLVLLCAGIAGLVLGVLGFW